MWNNTEMKTRNYGQDEEESQTAMAKASTEPHYALVEPLLLHNDQVLKRVSSGVLRELRGPKLATKLASRWKREVGR